MISKVSSTIANFFAIEQNTFFIEQNDLAVDCKLSSMHSLFISLQIIMMRVLTKSILLISLLICIVLNTSTAQDYNFRNIGINDGLPSGTVNAVTQGLDGFMYFATTDGLVRYDGERMKLYRHINDDSTSIPVNKVKSLLTDLEGNIWCGHDKFGVSCFNPQTEKFTTIAFNKITSDKSFLSYINSLRLDKSGVIYACSFTDYNGIFVMDGKTKNVVQFKPSTHDPYHLLTSDCDNIIDMAFYADTLWLIGTTNGLVFYNPVKKEVWKCLKIIDTNNPTWLNVIGGFVIDKNKNFYFGSWIGGLHYYNFKTNIVDTYNKTETDRTIDGNAPKYFINDSILLVNSWDLFYFNTHSKKITRSSPDLLNKYSFTGRSSDIYRAADSSIWLSTLTGVSHFNPNKNDFKTKILFKPNEWLNVNPKVEFNWICYDSLSSSYIVNYHDVNAKTERFHFAVYDEHFNHLYDLPHPLTNHTEIFSYAGNNKGKIFFTGDIKGAQKILMLDLLRKKISDPFSKFPQLDSLTLKGLFLNQDTLCATTLNRKKILKFNCNTYELISEIEIKKEDKVTDEYFNSIMCHDTLRNLYWIASEYGIYKLNPLTGSLSLLINDSINQLMKRGSKRATALTSDRQGKLWFALQNGLMQYDAERDKVIKFLDEKYLPSLNTYNLFCDASGYLWSDCSKGVIRIDPVNYSVKLFNSNNGLQPFSYPGRTDLMSNGNLIIPFAGGFVLYDTRKQNAESKPVTPIITSLKNFDSEIKLNCSVAQLTRITLPFQNNSINIEFTALNFSNTTFTQYAYKLEGLSDQLVYSTIPSITYNNLQPGTYNFHLVSSWDGKLWSDERILKIIITPPWNRTWWFTSLVVGFAIIIVLAGYQYRISQIKREERLKAEFKNQLMEMEMTALRSQMNPHFIFNSLNSINRYVMQNDRLTASEYIAKFGKLIRNVLDNSRSETISLQAELSTLELYIQMEKLRFEDKFEYRIIVSDDVDTSGIKIPPMLIQPFVENSIWHGLMHKEDKGIVIIEAEMKSKTLLKISIEDNGIGRAKAAELKSKNTGHNSHGLKVTTERIKIINEIYKQENKVEVIDLYDDNKNASGTRVVLLIPVL